MIYTVQINEEQRVYLLKAVRHLEKHTIKPPDDAYNIFFLEDMLEGLPSQELNSPGVLHGFCY